MKRNALVSFGLMLMVVLAACTTPGHQIADEVLEKMDRQSAEQR